MASRPLQVQGVGADLAVSFAAFFLMRQDLPAVCQRFFALLDERELMSRIASR
jgi:hypothetical protein